MPKSIICFVYAFAALSMSSYGRTQTSPNASNESQNASDSCRLTVEVKSFDSTDAIDPNDEHPNFLHNWVVKWEVCNPCPTDFGVYSSLVVQMELTGLKKDRSSFIRTTNFQRLGAYRPVPPPGQCKKDGTEISWENGERSLTGVRMRAEARKWQPSDKDRPFVEDN
jgi:hypothetical protein